MPFCVVKIAVWGGIEHSCVGEEIWNRHHRVCLSIYCCKWSTKFLHPVSGNSVL